MLRLAAGPLSSGALHRPLTAALLLVASAEAAQSAARSSVPPPLVAQPVSFWQALALARAHYPRLQAEAAQVPAAQAEVQQVRPPRRPAPQPGDELVREPADQVPDAQPMHVAPPKRAGAWYMNVFSFVCCFAC